ncbi:MAG: serine hydrolase [Pseudomonadales bacterium]|nr:serine hydrolase [Pseudomonadales bacterium]MCP5215522.1 serine hydrolase [Pseudomonadales bacterium]
MNLTKPLHALFFIVTTALLGCKNESQQSIVEPVNAVEQIDVAYPVNFNRSSFLFLPPREKPGSYRHAHEIFPSRRIAKGQYVDRLPYTDTKLKINYQFEGNSYSMADYFERNNTTGFLVIKNGSIVYEGYFQGADESSLFTSFSVGKSIVSTLVGLALGDGLITSVNDKLVDYIPHYKNTGYENVTIKQALQMSSGVDFIENYDSKGNHFARLFENGVVNRTESFSEIMTSLKSRRPPGSLFNYSSGESTVLSELVHAVTGKHAADYLSEKIWSKIGMESDSFWWVDKDDMAFGAGSLSITLRDYARFGLLMLNDGSYEDKQILPTGWVKEATTPDAPQVQPGRLYEGYPLGYQYQWWTFPGGQDHAYSAVGVFGQYVYVNPAENIVIAVTSTWPIAVDLAKEAETFALFAAIEKALR